MSRLPVSVPSVVRAITVVENGRSGVAWSSFLVRLKVTLHSARRGWQASPGFVGDHMQGVTPVPIPNTEVKLLQPMILLSGKVGYRRLYGPRQVNPGEALFVFPPSVSTTRGRFQRGVAFESSRVAFDSTLARRWILPSEPFCGVRSQCGMSAWDVDRPLGRGIAAIRT